MTLSEETNMKFDCIVMNPPYCKNLHLKILAEAIKHLKDDGKIISLQPIDKWQKAQLFGGESLVEGIYVATRFHPAVCAKAFDIKIGVELGIVTNQQSSISIIDDYNLTMKIYNKLNEAISKAGLLKSKLDKEDKDYPVGFVVGVGLVQSGRPKISKSFWRFINPDVNRATRKGHIGHHLRYNATNSAEQHNVWAFYASPLMRFVLKAFGFGGIPYNVIPWIEGFIDENGKTPLDEEWSFEKLVKWFDLTKDDLCTIKKSLDGALNDDEQQLIEETMEKYK